MYNSRSSHYKRQVLQPEQDHVEEQSLNVNTDTAQEAETEEPAASRRATPSQPPRRRAKRRRNVELEPEEEDDRNQVPNSLYKRAVYDDPETLKYIKKTTWIRIPDTVSKASRNIMTVHYQETLQAVAGSTDDNVSSDLEQNIRRIARGINQNIKTLVVPGLMDKNLLDPSVTALKVTGKVFLYIVYYLLQFLLSG
ncbi:hypothetical protein BDF21DRAFT_195583 [Thamnidium elegans]|nr:hypothetical protein BDF21DRAFT_195583 [Thamnidium elegans]